MFRSLRYKSSLNYIDINEVQESQDAFSRRKTLENYIFSAGLAMKLERQPSEKESFELVLISTVPVCQKRQKE